MNIKRLKLQPMGDGTKQLPVLVHHTRTWPGVEVPDKGPFGHCAVRLDWHDDTLQAIVDDRNDDPAVHVKFDPEGKVTEILIRRDLRDTIQFD